MNLKEIKQLINASGGKLILSEGDLKESFIVMKISDYLRDVKFKDKCFCENNNDFNQSTLTDEDEYENNNLTDAELLDKINTDIEELKRRKQESDLNCVIESEFSADQKEEELNYEKI